ncbi:hypothetical protein [Microbacterium sp. NIBRBAC000506063]|uniref:hypothetical protein n=1 Tax=Microbacterium sp. NIBRBAC000506063 TaxID=2734618 RepID=UPI001BB73639|nr:hypothetical protein [Microbacterium sp. NIBRBAC000506063]QTV80407.1 hypothetical protein KAE78_05615 [Microbacterium sp. NIBRBAC000506063]
MNETASGESPCAGVAFASICGRAPAVTEISTSAVPISTAPLVTVTTAVYSAGST